MIVVDSAAVIDALSGVAGADALRARLASEELHAPDLLGYEVVSALRGLTLGGMLSEARALDLLTDFDDVPTHRWASADGLRRRAFALRHNVSAYDAAYLALAEALGCAVVTRDARLARSTGHQVEVVVL